jgi:hypothetical protein
MPEPLSVIAGSTAAEGSKVVVKEVLKETAENSIKESAVKESLSTIENSSLEALKAQNEAAIQEAKIQQIENNRIDGANRELKAHNDLQKEFPESEGYKVHQETYLRDSDGNIVKDNLSDEARRVDFMVEKEGQIAKSIEVTSETAPKEFQISKESQIRDSGGNFIKDRESGSLIKIPDSVKTEIRRYA